MYQKYHDALLSLINTKTTARAQKYFGELENPQEGNFAKGSLPIVYIDFVEDDTSKANTIDIVFSLYIVHISYSKNTTLRENSNNEIHDLLKDIYKNLAFKSVEGSQPIEMKRLQKIYDATAAGGYLSVYKKDISITIKNPIITGEI